MSIINVQIGNHRLKKSREKLKFEFGAIAGLSLTKLKLKGESTYAEPSINFSSSKDITGGLFLNIVLPRNQGKWSINNELLYTNYKIKGYGESNNNYGDYLKTDRMFEFSYIKMNNMLRYTHPVKSYHVFVNAGVSSGIAVKSSTYTKESKSELGVVTNYEGKLLNETKKIEYGVNFGLGAAYKKVSFEIRNEMTKGFSPYSELKTNVNRLFFIVGYRF